MNALIGFRVGCEENLLALRKPEEEDEEEEQEEEEV
jgi:hypothetical protein